MADTDLNRAIKVVFASGPARLNADLIARMQALEPELPLYVVSEFAPEQGRWVPFNPARGFRENLSRCRTVFRGKAIRFAGVLMMPGTPYRKMRLVALLVAPRAFMAFNENLDHFMLRPRSAGAALRHAAWRAKSFLRFQLRPGGSVYTFLWRLARPREWRRPLAYLAAALGGTLAACRKALPPAAAATSAAGRLEDGISVVIPSRDGKELLCRLLPGLVRELEGWPSQIIVSDNGSADGTEAFLRCHYQQVLIESNAAPLSFACAVNRGIRRARYSHVCLLNNDMTLEPGFFEPLRRAFDVVPDLFCATAQILFPPGERREETGKAVMPRSSRSPGDFPISCELPVPGEDLSYVLYGSGGCSLYDSGKLLALGGLDEIYEPAYVEDLDAGYRAWRQGWPTVFCAQARAIHEHRATTSRYFSAQDLERCLGVNYLRFLARCVASPGVFRRLWRAEIRRLNTRAAYLDSPSSDALSAAWRAPAWVRRAPRGIVPDELVLGLGSGEVSVFPGRRAAGRSVVLVASPALPFPLSHGGAVRIFNLMERAAAHRDLVLVAFVDELAPPPAALLDFCAEIVLVRRVGSHLRPRTERPDEVEQFDSPAYRGALRQTVRKWRPAIVQLELTHMAQFAADCAPAKTILVEHDITFDLYEQLVARDDNWEARQEHPRWLKFETASWRTVDCVVAMSEKDRRRVGGARCVCLPNGVDLERFRPSPREPDPGRLLFIGSFAHLPNLLALDFFLREVWPRLQRFSPALHLIAGSRHRFYLAHHRNRISLDLDRPGIDLEGFVADVRPAYERAAVVIAPLLASAGTNIKILEAMAMGKSIVSTPAGINGLDLNPGRDVVIEKDAAGFASAIAELFENPARRHAIGREARSTVECGYDWNAVAAKQEELYRSLLA